MALSRHGEWLSQRAPPKVDADNADEIYRFRDQRDVRRDSMSSWEQSLDMVSETLGNLTGNHEPRNHRINIPTRAGENTRLILPLD